MLELKKQTFDSAVNKEDIPQVIPTYPTDISPEWDRITKGMTEEQKDKLRLKIKELINRMK